jgi:hypothetical protein
MVTDVEYNLKGMELRSPAYQAPYKVVEVRSGERNLPRYYVVNCKGLGVADFGVAMRDAVWFRDAANEYAKRVLDDSRA